MIRRLVPFLLALMLACPLTAHAEAPHAVGQMLGTEVHEPGWSTWIPLNQFEVAPGVYNYAVIDAKVAQARAAGAVLQIQLIAYTSDVDRQPFFIDWAPSFYPPAYVLESGSYSALVPPYDNSTWRNAYLQAGAAFAKHCDAIPEIVSVIVCTGMDGETQYTKNFGADWQAIARQEHSRIELEFGKFVYTAMDVYAGAVSRVQLHLNCAPGAGDRMQRAEYADALGIALKHSGMLPDMDSDTGYGNYTGSWDHIRAYPANCWVESPTGNGNAEWMYWAMLRGLTVHPLGMDVHKEFFNRVDPWILNWVGSYVNRTVADTPGAWVVFRDMEYLLVSWGSGGVSGKPGPHLFYMTVAGDWEAVDKVDLPAGRDHPYYARQAGLVTRVELNVNDGIVGGRLRLIYLDHGTSLFTVNAGSGVWTLQRHNTGDWVVVSMPLDGWMPAQSIIIQAGDGLYVHLAEVKSNATPTATPSRTATPPPTPTKAPTVTATLATVTFTITPKPETATPTISVSATNAPTGTPGSTQTPWIITATPEIWEARLDQVCRDAADMGIMVHVTAIYDWRMNAGYGR